jgi:ribulose-5-phosphate 4-epimerase/fuculose-1-phosphate aldolase
MTTVEETRRDVVLGNHILAGEGVLDVFGHVSARHPDRPDRFFLSRSTSPAQVSDETLLEFDLDGKVVAGEGHPYLERFIHSEIYKARPDVGSVVHHHAPSIMPFAATGTPLQPIYHLGAVIGPEVPFWDSQDEFGDTSMLVFNPEMGASLARTLGKGNTALLKRHGAICVGETVPRSVFISVCMRDNGELQSNAMAMGEPDFLSPGEVEKSNKVNGWGRPLERAWEHYCRVYG